MKLLALPLALAFVAQDSPSDKVRVVTTLGVLRYAAEQVGGDRVAAESLSPSGQDPHRVMPTPDLQHKAAGADVFVSAGRSLDLWAKNVLDASGNRKIQPGQPGYVVASDSCSIEELPDQVSREFGDLHPEGNPHVWLDPLNMRVIAGNIAAALSKVDPAGKEAYERNLKAFERRLVEALVGKPVVDLFGEKGMGALERRIKYDELEDWLARKGMKDKLGGWLAKARPLRGVKVVSYHKTYVYLAKRFGIEIVGELEERPGIPPSPRHRDAIVEQVKAQGVRAILNESFYPRAAADYVAGETAAKVAITQIDVGASDRVPDYFALIDHLLDSVSEAAKK